MNPTLVLFWQELSQELSQRRLRKLVHTHEFQTGIAPHKSGVLVWEDVGLIVTSSSSDLIAFFNSGQYDQQ